MAMFKRLKQKEYDSLVLPIVDDDGKEDWSNRELV